MRMIDKLNQKNLPKIIDIMNRKAQFTQLKIIIILYK